MKSICLLVLICLFNLALVPACPAQEAEHNERIINYMKEFVSGDLLHQKKTRTAIEQVLSNLPDEAADRLLSRDFPILFIMSYTTTIARFARAQAFFVEPDDPPHFAEGLYIITLADELESKGTVEAIAGIVAHELAHKYLEHLRAPTSTCEMERQANNLIKSWGFEDAFVQAKDLFGAKHKSDSRCYEESEE